MMLYFNLIAGWLFNAPLLDIFLNYYIFMIYSMIEFDLSIYWPIDTSLLEENFNRIIHSCHSTFDALKCVGVVKYRWFFSYPKLTDEVLKYQ